MTYAMPGDVTLIDRNFDGKIDRIYAADLGGNIWRVDLETSAGNQPSNWMVNKFAAVGGATSDATKRKFFYPPDVVATRNFDMVLAATGDREHPLRLNPGAFNTINRFYGLKDTNNGVDGKPSVPPTTWTPITDATSSTGNSAPSGLFNCTACVSGGTVYDNSGSGYYISMLASGGSSATGEKGVNAPASIGGFTYFSTNEPKPPSTNSCVSNLGTARGYRVATFTGAVGLTTFSGGGLPPSPVIGLVTVTYPGATSPTTVPFLIGGGVPGASTSDAVSPIGAQIPAIILNGKRVRTYWNTDHDK
jgi:type IV pilus assembly protein PilY1